MILKQKKNEKKNKALTSSLTRTSGAKSQITSTQFKPTETLTISIFHAAGWPPRKGNERRSLDE